MTRKRSFAGSVFTMASGSGVSQAILAISAPALTRLYSVEAFALAAVFMAVTSLIAVGAAGRFEFALMLPRDRREAADVLLGAIALLAIVTGIVIVGSVGFAVAYSDTTSWLDQGLLFWIPAGTFVTAMWNIESKWLAREGRFSGIAAGEIIYAVVAVAMPVVAAVAWTSPNLGLVAGHVGGRIAAEAYVGQRILRDIGSHKPSLRGAARMLGRYRRFPILSFPAGLVSTASHYLPTLMLSPFGPGVVGAYALANRVVTTPMSLVGQAVSHVFFPRIARLRDRPKEARGLLLAAYVGLLLFIAPFAGFLALFGGPMFRAIFGVEWESAGEMAALMVPIMVARFVVAPPSLMMQAFERQGALLIWTLASTVFAAGGLAAGIVWDEWRLGIQIYSWVGAVMYGVFLLLTLRVLPSKDGEVRETMVREVREAVRRAGRQVTRIGRYAGIRRVVELLLRVRYVGGVSTTIGGQKVKVVCRSLADYRAVRRFRSFEGPFLERYLQCARQARVVVDVGANIGLYSLAAVSVNPRVEVHAFEPEASVVDCLKRTMLRNRRGRVTVHAIALGARDEMQRLATKGRSGHYIVADGSVPLSLEYESEYEVTVRSLASLISEGAIPPPDLIKIDVEGYEFAVVKGLMPALLTTSPVLFIEVHETLLTRYGATSDLLEAELAALGYRAEVVRSPRGDAREHSQTHVIFWPPGTRAVDAPSKLLQGDKRVLGAHDEAR